MKRGVWRSGDPFVWWTGGALAVSLIMVIGLVGLILASGLGFFWPGDLTLFKLADGTAVLGEVAQTQAVPHEEGKTRTQVKKGNRDLGQPDFVWIDDDTLVGRERPADAAMIERLEWGNFYGTLVELKEGGASIAKGPDAVRKALPEKLEAAEDLRARIHGIEKDEIGHINHKSDKVRLALKRLQMDGVTSGLEVERLRREALDWQAKFEAQAKTLGELRAKPTASLVLRSADDLEKEIPLSQVVRVVEPNRMGVFAKSAHYVAKLWEFVAEDPREANTEGGIFPAIFGTVMMVFIMSLFTTPLGILAALYLREYARQGPLVSAVRIAVNNLAGVPSIVFGVFGVGFFIYTVGGTIDRWFFSESLPTPTFGTGGILWASLTLSLLTVPVVIVATEEGLAAIPRSLREGSLALGATKWETTWRVILPALTPSILTGVILAMARAAGEVAPLMITGVVKLAPALPLDGYAPFFHADRKFMHLGFHIYDAGFQSPNVDAARPMVFMTTVLLILVVVSLNLTAIVLRSRLRRRYRLSGM